MADKYCHQCGQVNSNKRLALSDFFEEFLANIISYDSRIWRTINGILFSPGKVTREYCAGRRMDYANPFRFFLTVSIVFFLLVQLMASWNGSLESINLDSEKQDFFQMTSDSLSNKDATQQLIKTRDSLQESGDLLTSSILTKVIEKQDTSNVQPVGLSNYITQEELDNKYFLVSYVLQTGDYMDHYAAHNKMTIDEALDDLKHRKDRKNKLRYLKATRIQSINQNPGLAIPILLPRTPLFLFFFAPIMSLFFWLLYARRAFNYMEHTVFNFHLFTFIFLSMYVMLAEYAIVGSSWLASLFFAIIGPIYLYKAMRRFYLQGRIKTIVKFVFINFVFFVLFFFSGLVFLLGSIFISA